VLGDDEQRQHLAAPRWSLTIGIVAGGTTTTERVCSLARKIKFNRMLLLIGVVSQKAVSTGGAPERTSRTLREPSGVPGGNILAAHADGSTQDQGSRP
jgi:hypothetical protein